MRSFIFPVVVCVLVGFPALVQAQHDHAVTGVVRDADSLPLVNAAVRWLDAPGGATTNAEGRFTLARPHGASRLLVSHVAWEADTLVLGDIHTGDDAPLVVRLWRVRSLGSVEVSAEAPATYHAPATFKTEVITSKELENAPCCDLSGCFSTTSSVQPSVTDVITDTKELTMLGLDGAYTQILIDNVPTLSTGLNQMYGPAFIPGPMIDRIFVSKGSNSVIQGPESISGQINVLLREDLTEGPVFFNAFVNSFLEKQFNAIGTQEVGTWRALLGLHTVQAGREVDGDGNGFLDAPRITRYTAFTKWMHEDEEAGVRSHTGAKYTWEDRIGGQRGFDAATMRGSLSRYGQVIENRRAELLHKTELLFDEGRRLNMHAAASSHVQDAWYGATTYGGRQTTVFADALYTFPVMEEYDLTIGGAYRLFDLDEEIRFLSNPLGKTYDGTRSTLESVPALLAENTVHFFDDALTMIAGIRADFFNEHGTIATPRLLFKYDATETTVLRVSAGSGFRTAHPFAENQSLLASWRNILLPSTLAPERSFSTGASLTQMFDVAGMGGTFSFDAYHTVFSKQVIADFDHGPDVIVIENLGGRSTATSIVAELSIEPADWLALRGSWSFTEAFEDHGEVRRELPFLSRQRGMLFASITPRESAWRGTVTLEVHGSQRLPDTRMLPTDFQLAERSPSYVVLNAQLTHDFGLFELYGGVENLLDVRQANPILNAGQPFGQWFEPSFVWGPVKGRELFLGLRTSFASW